MAAPERPLSVGEVIGENIRRLREDRRWTQQELAVRLRANGLGWTRHQVAAIEIGRREDLEVSALLILLSVLDVPVDDLFASPNPRESVVQVTPNALTARQNVRLLIEGSADRVRWALSPAASSSSQTMAVTTLKELRAAEKAGEVPVNLDADQRLAQRLGVEVDTVVEAAERLWSHSLTEERNRRVAALGPDAGDRRARRGHITRELGREVEQGLAQRGEGP